MLKYQEGPQFVLCMAEGLTAMIRVSMYNIMQV
jgi:hypothetical protein